MLSWVKQSVFQVPAKKDYDEEEQQLRHVRLPPHSHTDMHRQRRGGEGGSSARAGGWGGVFVCGVWGEGGKGASWKGGGL